jgi:lipopolysaccharide transport system ATP-binding protein
VLQVHALGKVYRQWGSDWRRVASWCGLPFHAREEHWVLRDVSFGVGMGEAVGIVGQNGAGKSTLLKIITGIVKPSEGSIELNGRVSAILELGMGFNSDFTGRENAYHSAGLMGFIRREIDRMMSKIEDFAEIGDYFDQPVRTYSSGMQMRLAFSVATAQRPDVLIVDEALSVGDAYFQHKSFNRIREFRERGTTLLIVSHDKGAIQSVCDRAVLLSAGRIAMEGVPEAVMDYYNAMLAERENQTVRQRSLANGKIQTISGSGEATVTGIALLNSQGERVEVIDVGSTVTLEIKVEIHAAIPRLILGYMIKDRLGQPMFGTNTHHLQCPQYELKPGEELAFRFTFDANLGEGSYSIATALVSTDTHLVDNYEWRDLALVFNVANISKHHFIGNNWLPQRWEVHR